MFISRLFALATAGLASLSLVAASPIAAPPAPGTQELAKRSNVDYVYNTLVELDLALNVPCDAICAFRFRLSQNIVLKCPYRRSG